MLSSESSLPNNQICLVENQSSCKLAVFQRVSVKVAEHLLEVTGLKSCDLDPVPACILKGCKSILLLTLTSIVNLSFQSACIPGIAYKHRHSTETALVKVQNNILCAIDDNKGAALLLWDMYRAFDTFGYKLPLDRMCSHFGLRGKVLKWFESYLHNKKNSL